MCVAFKYTGSTSWCACPRRANFSKEEKLSRTKRVQMTKLEESFVWPSIAMLFTKRISLLGWL